VKDAVLFCGRAFLPGQCPSVMTRPAPSRGTSPSRNWTALRIREGRIRLTSFTLQLGTLPDSSWEDGGDIAANERMWVIESASFVQGVEESDSGAFFEQHMGKLSTSRIALCC
jgi:hypothetical protein